MKIQKVNRIMTWCTAYAEVHSFLSSPNKSCAAKYERENTLRHWAKFKINLVLSNKVVQEVSKMLEFAQIVS